MLIELKGIDRAKMLDRPFSYVQIINSEEMLLAISVLPISALVIEILMECSQVIELIMFTADNLFIRFFRGYV
jgi:hypothetical protein